MAESTDREALERLAEALTRRDILAHIAHTTRWGGESGDSIRRTPSLKLDRHLIGAPDLVITPSWAPIYMWGRTTWPVDDPDGFAEEIASRYAQREACGL